MDVGVGEACCRACDLTWAHGVAFVLYVYWSGLDLVKEDELEVRGAHSMVESVRDIV